MVPFLGRLNSLRLAGKMGGGGSGRVYIAQFDEKVPAAVKKLDVVRQDAERDFENEVDWLSKIWHQNIVFLLGYCILGEARFLVYEMMHHGSLETQLHGPSQGSSLTWHICINIVVDVASRISSRVLQHSSDHVIYNGCKSSVILSRENPLLFLRCE